MLRRIFEVAISQPFSLLFADNQLDPRLLFADIQFDPRVDSIRKALHDSTHPFILSSVCRSWREIAFSTPSIWADLLVEFPNHMADDDKCVLLQGWFQRSTSSQSSKMTIAVSFDFATSKQASGMFSHAIADILSTHIHCCQTLMIDCGLDGRSAPLINRLAVCFGQANYMRSLDKLIITDTSVADSLADLRGCPLLQSLRTHVRFDDLKLVQDDGSAHSALQHVHLSGHLHHIYSCLAQCPLLKKVQIFTDAIPSYIDPNATFGKEIILPNLDSLSIYLDASRRARTLNIVPLLNTLSAPSLVTLRVSICSDPILEVQENRHAENSIWVSFVAHLSHSAPQSLRYLSFWIIDDIRSNVDVLIEVFRKLPMLETLIIENHSREPFVTVRFWEALSASPSLDHQKLLPHLGTLSVQDKLYYSSAIEIERFILSRITTDTSNWNTRGITRLLVEACQFTSIEEFYDSCTSMLPHNPEMDICIHTMSGGTSSAQMFLFMVK